MALIPADELASLEETAHLLRSPKNAARLDLRYWVDTHRRTASRVLDLTEAALREPFAGIGKPEPLKHLGPAIRARRITGVDRLVCKIYNDRIDFLQARYHY